MTVMRPGDCYIGGTPGTTVTGAGYTTVIGTKPLEPVTAMMR
jgi:hypothetical protein